MKKISTLIAGLVLSLYSYSQYVTINDAGFVNWLTSNYPSCMSGNQMDTTCTDITSAGWVSISGYTINDLDGLQYFDALSTFICMNNSVSNIPYLPQPNIIQYKVANNNLTSIPNLPSTVINLDIRQNNLTSIPALPSGLQEYLGGDNPNLPLPTFPTTITVLDISDNNLSSFPALWPGITNLSIGGNPAATLPPMPPNLEVLRINNQGLTQLPPLPNTITNLEAQFNDFTVVNSFPPNVEWLNLTNCSQLDSVYNIPNSVTTLTIQNCGLKYIGNLPANVSAVYLDYNDLTALPPIPAGIDGLNIDFNQISTIDYLPATMNSFRAINNNLECLPIIPNVSGSINLNLTGNPLPCLPNYTDDMNATLLNKPLCVANDPVNNPQGCPTAEGISGYIYEDTNVNCSRQNYEVGIQNIPVRIYDSGMNQLGVSSSFSNGRYFFPAVIGTYDVYADTTGKPILPSCLNPGVDSTVVLSGADTLADNVDFGFECKPGFDIGATSLHTDGWVFPGQEHTVSFNIGDLSNFYNLACATGTGGTVTITFSGPVNYISNEPGTLTPSVAGLTFTYAIADFGSVDFFNDFGLVFETQTTAQSGDQVCVDVDVTPTTGDVNPSNNNFSFCYEVVNSYDPNNKLVYPKEVEPGFDDYLYYTINFQNTGSAPAFNIRLLDTLSNELDLETFEVIDYSHSNHFMLDGNVLQVFFPDIMLIDSTTNEPESKGFVTFKVKPETTLSLGDTIENEAYIYFDFNAPILTNTAKTAYVSYADLQELANDVNVYPVPFKDYFHVKGLQAGTELILTDVLGQMIWTKKLNGNKRVETSGLKPGFYFLTYIDGNQSKTIKLLKE